MSTTRSHTTSLFALTALLLTALCGSAPPSRADQVTAPAVLTQHNDNARTGANRNEAILTPSNVNVATFGKLFSITGLDAPVNSQVLYVPNLMIHGGLHNVIFAYTSNNGDNSPCSVYAYDADVPGTATSFLWHHPLPLSARWTTSTPVIDPETNTMYVLTKDTNDNGPNRLRAINILTGDEKPGSPITISATIPGTGAGSVGGLLSFPDGTLGNGQHNNCRPGLILLNDIIYIGFAHNSDSPPYHGWIFGYRYDQTQFTQTAVFCISPNSSEGGIWQTGKGLTADDDGYLYCTVGNGAFSIPPGGRPMPNSSYGMCVLKLHTPDLSVADFFCPFDELAQSNRDADTGNAGPVGIPGTNRLFIGNTKFGSMFLLNSSDLGGFQERSGGLDRVLQRFDGFSGGVGQNPVCWDAITTKYIYQWPNGSNLLQLRYDPDTSNFNPAGVYKQTTGTASGGPGGFLAISASGSRNGILWGIDNGNHIVRAFDATDVSQPQLWNSTLNAARDALASAGKWQFPVVANGRVYVPSGSGSIEVYGLLANSTATVSGTITLQGCVNSVQPITFEFRPTDGSAAFVETTMLNASGTFSLNYVPRKSYTVWIKGAKWLARVVPVDTSAGNVSGVTATLLAGDVNNDNMVTTSDYLALKAAFGSHPGDPNYNPGADLNCDDAVTTADYLLLKANFGMAGDP